jgi:N4-bis(aminopropyl)spermidine synthase
LAEDAAIVAEVAGAVGLEEGEAGVRAVISALARLEPVSIRRISRTAGLPVPIVASVCGELRKRHLVADERPAQLSRIGRELFSAGRLRLDSSVCAACSGLTFLVPAELAPSVRDVAKLAREAPAPRYELDQCHCTVETKIRRVLALHEADALVGRRILVLGDDDLVSLAIASVVRRFGSTATIAGLTVVDVDREIVAFARKRLARAPFPVSCVLHDLRDPLPAGLVGRFDTVLTDPPYTPSGARLFLSRAATAVREGGQAFLSFGSKRPAATYAVQREIVRMGFAIESLVPDFNRYVGAGVLGGTSDLYRLFATTDVRPLVGGRFEGPLYTSEI